LYLTVLTPVFLAHSSTAHKRQSNHWSRRLSPDNPRGYNEEQLRKIADAPTLAAKRQVEQKIMNMRIKIEKKLVEPIVDEYGLDRIHAMMAEMKASYTELERRGWDAGGGEWVDED
jgi:hypothetical protein